MNFKTTLVASAALSAYALAGFAAEAKPQPHHRPHAARLGGDVAGLRSEVEALKSQVQALEGRLDAQFQAQQQTQAQIQATQAQVQIAQNQAQDAQAAASVARSSIETLPTVVASVVKKAAPKPGWAVDTTLGGTVFFDVSHISNKSNGVATPQSGTNFDIKRLYLQVDHRFNDVFSANVTTDFIYDSGSSATQLFIKKAWLQAKVSDALVIRAGASELTWAPFVEKLYGYRYVENTFIDRTKFGTTTDWGLHASGVLANSIISYQVSVVDGEGFKKPATGVTNRTHAVDVEGRVAATYDHFTVAVGAYDGKLGNDVTGVPTFNTARRIDVAAAYVTDRFRIGGEYLWAKDWADVLQANPAKTNTTEGYSVFGSLNLTSKVAVFGRYDWIKPKKNTAPTFDDDYFNVGVSYSPIKPLDFALVYKREQANNASLTSTNGVVGGTINGTYNEIGLFSQVKF